jgi:hypothetical protein
MPIQQEADKRVSAMVPAADANAFESLAEQNGRSTASELRLAIQAWLKQNGRRPK